MMPTFGRNMIRRFGKNVSGMKKMAARDFEDILQVRDASYAARCAHSRVPDSVSCPASKASFLRP